MPKRFFFFLPHVGSPHQPRKAVPARVVPSHGVASTSVHRRNEYPRCVLWMKRTNAWAPQDYVYTHICVSSENRFTIFSAHIHKIEPKYRSDFVFCRRRGPVRAFTKFLIYLIGVID